MTDEERNLDAARNKASCLVFQTALKTPETVAVVFMLITATRMCPQTVVE